MGKQWCSSAIKSAALAVGFPDFRLCTPVKNDNDPQRPEQFGSSVLQPRSVSYVNMSQDRVAITTIDPARLVEDDLCMKRTDRHGQVRLRSPDGYGFLPGDVDVVRRREMAV